MGQKMTYSYKCRDMFVFVKRFSNKFLKKRFMVNLSLVRPCKEIRV